MNIQELGSCLLNRLRFYPIRASKVKLCLTNKIIFTFRTNCWIIIVHQKSSEYSRWVIYEHMKETFTSIYNSFKSICLPMLCRKFSRPLCFFHVRMYHPISLEIIVLFLTYNWSIQSNKCECSQINMFWKQSRWCIFVQFDFHAHEMIVNSN